MGPSFAGTERHVAGVFDGDQLRLYLDGSLVASTAVQVDRVATSDYPLTIGSNAQIPGRDFDGLVREARVYNRALSDREIAGTAAEPEGLVAHVRLTPSNTATVPRDGADRFYAYGGFLEPAGVYNDDNFCMNGIVNPDRTPKPAMAAIKYAQRPVLTESFDPAASTVRVTSFFDHVMLDDAVIGFWSLHADGRQLVSGGIDTPLPRESGMVTLDLPDRSPARSARTRAKKSSSPSAGSPRARPPWSPRPTRSRGPSSRCPTNPRCDPLPSHARASAPIAMMTRSSAPP